MKAVVELVVVRQGVNLRLGVTDFVDRLHLASDLGADPAKFPANTGKTAVCRVLARADCLQEDLQRRQVAAVGNVQMAIVLGMGVDDRVELALLLGLVFPVGVHRQPEGILPFFPVVHLDAFVAGVRVNLFLAVVGRFPAEIAGQQFVLFFQAKLFLGSRHIHDCLLLAVAAAGDDYGRHRRDLKFRCRFSSSGRAGPPTLRGRSPPCPRRRPDGRPG